MKWVTVECPGCRKPNMVDPSVTSELVCSHCDEKTLVVSTGTIGSLSGEILGENYQIEERIGQGGFGEVYRARDRLLQRLVAVKVLAQPTGPDTERSGRFLREAVTAAQITHPNVVHIYDVGSDPKRGLHYLVMEFVDGRNLKERVEAEGPLGEGEVAAIGLQIARGLSAAHSQGIVHRDIKPGNIMEAREGGVKITDFGLARILQVDHATKTQTAGSVAYMPPEQFEGRPVDERADLYSFGATLYFLLSGKTPYPGVHDFNVMYNILSREATPLPDVAPETSLAMWELIRDLIQKEPEKRPSGADEVIGRLESLLARDAASIRPCGSCGSLNEPGVDFCSGCGKSLDARPTSPAAAAPRASELDHTVKSAPVQKRKVSRHRVPLGWAGLAVGGLIILAGAIWGPSFLTSSPDPVLPEAEGPKSTAAVSSEGAELLRRGDFGGYLERGEEPLATQVGKLQGDLRSQVTFRKKLEILEGHAEEIAGRTDTAAAAFRKGILSKVLFLGIDRLDNLNLGGNVSDIRARLSHERVLLRFGEGSPIEPVASRVDAAAASLHAFLGEVVVKKLEPPYLDHYRKLVKIGNAVARARKETEGLGAEWERWRGVAKRSVIDETIRRAQSDETLRMQPSRIYEQVIPAMEILAEIQGMGVEEVLTQIEEKARDDRISIPWKEGG